MAIKTTVDHSNSLSAANKAQVAIPSNPHRVEWTIVNISETETLWVNIGQQANMGLGSIPILPNGFIRGDQTEDIYIIGAVMGTEYTAKEETASA